MGECKELGLDVSWNGKCSGVRDKLDNMWIGIRKTHVNKPNIEGTKKWCSSEVSSKELIQKAK